jgi:SPP1 gp7 family putative phage head morphogenesis protein
VNQRVQPASNSSKYRSFINERDKALEKIFNNYLNIFSSNLNFLLDQVIDVAAGLNAKQQKSHYLVTAKPMYEQKLDMIFRMAAAQSFELAKRLRVSTYTLAHAGEAEALSRSTGNSKKVRVNQETLTKAMNKQTMSGGSLKDRIDLIFNRLKRDVIDAIELSLVREDNVEDTIARIKRAFPKPYQVKRPPRELKPVKVKEADYKIGRGKSLSDGIIDNDAWQQVVDDYFDEILDDRMPFGRSDYDAYKVDNEYAVAGESEVETRYGWELEQEMTNDFVQNVRDGQIDAANENGIEDFQWIAIIDNKTDECCAWRDGLTTKEIEEELQSNHKDDECDTVVPPAHPNCRCTLAPMVKDMPDAPLPDFGGFDEWLMS